LCQEVCVEHTAVYLCAHKKKYDLRSFVKLFS
jgi:hypothetical protein